MKKSHGTFKLRAVLGKWYILMSQDGKPDDRAGPYTYATAQARCSSFKAAGWSDGDAAT